MDSTAGYYNYSETDIHARRFSQVARLSYDWNVMSGLNIVPFVEGSMSEYSNRRESVSSDVRYNSLAGVTTQARFQRGYSGFGKFNGFKHIFVPSVTYFHDNASSLGIDEVPRFDDIDNRPARDRVESKFDNILLGRNAANGETWRVAKLAVYHGNDLSNEVSKGTDYEIDMEIRPRPWWGFRAFAERHRDETEPGFVENDFDRRLAFVFYDDNNYENSFNARLGYSLTNINNVTINREVLYGAGYKLSPKWSFSADHTFDLEDNEIRRQSYQIRRRMHKWDMGLRVRERPSGTDINVVMSLVGFSGAELRF
jgi:hypothetical protein